MNTVWKEVNFRLQGTNITDATIAPVKDITSLVSLNLGATKVSDAGLVHIKGLTNLTRLYLDLTSVSDAGLANLTDAFVRTEGVVGLSVGVFVEPCFEETPHADLAWAFGLGHGRAAVKALVHDVT